MKKILIGAAAAIMIIVAAGYGWLSYAAQRNHASPTPVAMAALQSADAVTVEQQDDWLIMRPRDDDPTVGVIVYPGAYCDIRGYAPVFRDIATAGYLVIGVSMPFDFAIFAPFRADAVRAAFPEIRRWVIVGHSMGGAMAGVYAAAHQDELAGVIFWDAYPPESSSLADASLPVVHIHRATPDGRPPEKLRAMRHLFPPDSQWIPIRGGIHMYFGSFDGGSYEEQWTPGISEAEQLRQVGKDTVAALATMR